MADNTSDKTPIENLSDNLLAKRLKWLNLKYIKYLDDCGKTKQGTMQYGNAVIDMRMCECDYKAAVKEALSRGILI